MEPARRHDLKFLARASAALVLTCAAAVLVEGQEPIRIGARTVAVYATVTDSTGRLVPDLTRDDFEIYDNGKRQPLTVFESALQPVAIVVLLDRSASMQTNFRLVEVAAGELLKGLLPADKARIGSFATRIQLDPREFTSDRGELLTILRTELQPAGPTPLWNAVSVAVTALRQEPLRRVILVFTDGVDNTMGGRTVGLHNVMRAAQADDVMVYAVGLTRDLSGRGRGQRGRVPMPTPPPTVGLRQPPSVQKPDPGLSRIAAETGGGYFELSNAAHLMTTFARVADELHRQYALGFEPPKLDGKVHKLELHIKRPGLTARARKSYLARKSSES
jgi:Ca-activated chloride channel family protein